MTLIRLASTACLLTLSLAGCGRGAPRAAAGTDGSTGSIGDGVAPPLAEAPGSLAAEVGSARTASAPSGRRVTLHLPEALAPGPGRFRVELPAGLAYRDLSADLVSPTMPMHGVVRVALAAGPRPGTAEIGVDIPMEGTWALYVNLDGVGADAAEFVFEVPPGPDGYNHGGSSMPMSASALPDTSSGDRSHDHRPPDLG